MVFSVSISAHSPDESFSIRSREAFGSVRGDEGLHGESVFIIPQFFSAIVRKRTKIFPHALHLLPTTTQSTDSARARDGSIGLTGRQPELVYHQSGRRARVGSRLRLPKLAAHSESIPRGYRGDSQGWRSPLERVFAFFCRGAKEGAESGAA